MENGNTDAGAEIYAAMRRYDGKGIEEELNFRLIGGAYPPLIDGLFSLDCS
jgi:hypothetical protein